MQVSGLAVLRGSSSGQQAMLRDGRERPPHLSHQSGPGDAKGAGWPDESRDVIQIDVIRAEVRERVDRDDGVEEVVRERTRSRIAVNRKHAVSDPASRMRRRFSDACCHWSAAQTCTPNSGWRKMDDAGRPHPKSSTRIPGRRSSDSASHSVSHQHVRATTR